jgi:phosphonate transport system permease protein
MATPNTLSLDDIARLEKIEPRLFRRPLSERVVSWGTGALLLAVFLFGLWWIDASPVRVWEGLGKLGFLIQFMIPPSAGGAFWDHLSAIGETLAMAFLGTMIAAVLAVPLGFLGAKNVVVNRLFHFSLRRVFDGFRAVDSLIWALVFVSAVGMGPFAGVLALVLSDLPVLAKVYAEAIENIDRKPVEGVRAAGASELHTMRLGVFPQVVPVMLSNVLFFFESNVRSATILGTVGAGGIGLALSDRIRINNWDEAAFIILLILVTVAIIDALSRRIRMRIIQGEASRS